MTRDVILDLSRSPGCARSSLAAVGAVLTATALLGSVPTALAAGALAPRPVAQAASAVPTDVRLRPVYGPLQAGQIAQIQNLGRSVLTAKHSQQPSAEEQALVGELHALSSEINQAILPKEGQVTLSTDASQSARTAAQSAIQPLSKGEGLRNALQPHLTRLHERRAALEAAVPMDAESHEAHLERAQHLSNQVAEIERSVQAAMALPDDERHARLMELSKQLTPRSQAQWLQEQRREAIAENPSEAASAIDLDHPTPTVTTLVAHRPGPTGQATPTAPSGHAPSAGTADTRSRLSSPAGKRPTKL